MMDSVWVGRLIVIVCSVLGSGGLWAYLQSRDSKKNATTRLMMGMAYDKLMSRATMYTNRGWITRDEFEDYLKYFYEPYRALGGNGAAERVMNDVRGLPFRSPEVFRIRQQEGEFVNNVRLVERPQQASVE